MTLAMLSWAATKTLINTLESYRKYGLDQLDVDKVIFFQEYSKEDKAIAKDFGYESFGSPENIGIAEAYKLLVAYASGDLFLFLENDWECVEQPRQELFDAEVMLREKTIDVARFRSRDKPGEPLWSRQYRGNEYSRPEYLLDSVYWELYPQMKFPEIWSPQYPWYAAKARHANWTNNPTMFRTEWLRENIVEHIEGDIEVSLQPWWKEQDFIVAQSWGFFTHSRID